MTLERKVGSYKTDAEMNLPPRRSSLHVSELTAAKTMWKTMTEEEIAIVQGTRFLGSLERERV